MSIRGFLLSENLVALAILGLMIALASGGLVHMLKLIQFSKVSSKAFIAGTTVLENLRRLPVNQIQNSTIEVPVGNHNFTGIINVCPSGTYCSQESKTVRVRITHQGKQLYEVSTIFSTLR
ncbi:MAG: hypothetical protein N2654_00890 [Deltaproteobacteria bacterium]|nr:hypothetical protein [Deltaproteobacteria bacterium]